MMVSVQQIVKITPQQAQPLMSFRDFLVANGDFTTDQTEINEVEGCVVITFSYEEEV